MSLMEKRILLIIPLLSSYRSFFMELGDELHAKGYSVFLLTDNSMNESVLHVNIIHLKLPRTMKPLEHLKSVFEIRRIVKEVNPDLIHTHFSASIFTVALAKTRDWPTVIATFHGLSFPLISGYFKRKLLKLAEIYAASKMNKVCVLTEDDAELLRHNLKATEVYCYKSMGIGCDIHRFDKSRYTSEMLIRRKLKLHIQDTDIVLVFVGRFVDFKGFHLVARAFNKLADSNIKLLLLGNKDSIHPTGLSEQEEVALFSNPNVIDVGFVNNVDDYLAITDLMVFPSVREGMPVCIMEALSMCVPVIVPDSRGCNVLVSDGNNGMILKNLSVESICDTIIKLKPKLKDNTMRTFMVAERVKYDRRVYVEEQIAIYKAYFTDDF